MAAFRHCEEGSVTAFSLFIFMMMLFVGGMAVDLMRFETRRAALQNTLDSATLAATSLRSDADAEQLVKDIMTKRGYDPALTQVTVSETRTGADPNTGDPGTLVARAVRADYDLDMNTIFMPFLGIETLGTLGTGGAKEGMQTVEISLVVDVSGSMAGQRIADLKVAATNFIDLVVDPARTDLPVTISIIPFNHTVKVPDSLLGRLNTNEVIFLPVAEQTTDPDTDLPYRGALQAFDRTNPTSKCVRFMDDELMTTNLEADLDPASNPNYLLLRAISQTQELDRVASYFSHDYSTAWCTSSMPEILPFGTDATVLKEYIEDLSAWGATSNDTGLKWGVALLDPEFRAVVSDMVTDGELPAAIDGRPYDYNPTNFLKVVVLMTDGANTQQFDLDERMKNGPSRVWFSQTAADATGNEYDGYYVLMPNNSSSQRFMRPHKLGKSHSSSTASGRDGEWVSVGSLPSDAVQLSYTQLYNKLPNTRDVAYLFYDRDKGDSTAYYDHLDANIEVIDNYSDGEADRRMSGSPSDSSSDHGICDIAKVHNDILVYTIAFQAGSAAEDVMRDCATSNGYYFNASDGTALNNAFAAIAGSITTLRLTQ